jgi:hypothetical protein
VLGQFGGHLRCGRRQPDRVRLTEPQPSPEPTPPTKLTTVPRARTTGDDASMATGTPPPSATFSTAT